MQYFQQFPQTTYTLTESGGGQTARLPRVVPNMTIKLQMNIFDDTNLPYSEYRVRDEDRPDTVAAILYGSSRYAWVILLANNMRDWYDWPLTEVEFANYMNRKYEDPIGARNGLVRSADINTLNPQYIWVLSDGRELEVDADTYATLPTNEQKTVSVYEQEYTLNDDRRTIRVPTLDAIPMVVSQFADAVSRP